MLMLSPIRITSRDDKVIKAKRAMAVLAQELMSSLQSR
jgi:hypothetical protein